MSISSYGIIVIIGCCLVTLIPRITPIMLFSKFQIPEGFKKWLEHIPVAIMTALLVNELLIDNGQVSLSANYLELIVAIPTFIVAIKTKSPILTVIVGVVSLMVLRMIF
ncbi:MAG: AzlD domain-containing protein [Clostridia bacterium]|nr:AzlD domain-containing protein [Clostridia bacterium]